MKHAVAGLLAVSLSACTPTKGGIPPVGLDLYILAGQSNMVGADTSAAPRFEHQGRIWLFGNDLVWHPGQEPTDDPFVPVQPYPVNQAVNPGISPGMAFADAMVAHNGRPVGLIPCAHGGSTIAQWQPNQSTDTLYGACLAMVRKAFPMGRIRGVLFWQGEANTLSPELAREWDPGFTVLVAALRLDLEDPNLPVVFAQIGPFAGPTRPDWATVQKAQEQFTAPNVAMVITRDLPLIAGDYLHVSGEGMLNAGRRFAEAMAQFVN